MLDLQIEVEGKVMKGQFHRKEKLNNLNGKTWTRYSISIWDIIKSPEENKLKHPAMFPIELCKRLIEIYSKKGDTILDPFMGSGSTIVAAKDLERKGIGIEINPDFMKIAKKRLSQQKLLESNVEETPLFCDDAAYITKHLKPDSIDLVITSPPYWNIHTRKRTADYKESRPYSTMERDLGNIEDFNEFMEQLKIIFEKIWTVVKSGKKCIVVVMDIRQGSDFIPFHMNVCNMMKDINFTLEDVIIWDRRREYNNLRPLGFPYAFIVNKTHEYILIFRKNKAE